MIGCFMLLPLGGLLLAMGAVTSSLILAMGVVISAVNITTGLLTGSVIAVSTAFLALWMFLLS
jgi:hypothetical protein